jgi:uncharacterized membrane protein YdjX (TVP38/TMEM64 family)
LFQASRLTPFVATGCLLGLSAISLRDYMLGTPAALPALLGYVSLGAFARADLLASTGLRFQWVLLATGSRRPPWPSRTSGASFRGLRAESEPSRPDAN